MENTLELFFQSTLELEEDLCHILWLLCMKDMYVDEYAQGLESGEIALAVGTHSLISDSVRFANLGLAVVDEQHRFGVAQRGRLNSKVKMT